MMIEGINILDQTPIKECTTLSNIFMALGLGITIIAMIVFFTKQNQKRICFKDVGTKIFLFFYVLGLVMAISSVIQFPWFYAETGRYTYKCTFEDEVKANYISDNFNIIGVEDRIWTVENK